MADTAWAPGSDAALPVERAAARHSLAVRITHWITAFSFFALLLSGIEIVISHPRFYWGETGNVLTPALFQLPIPASRESVRTGYDFVLPDQNGWSRSLHFQSAWALVLCGAVYLIWGLLTGHFRKHLLPPAASLSWHELSSVVGSHLRLRRPGPGENLSYNVLQRLTYSLVIFAAFPLMLWTGLAMSPAVVSAFPFFVTSLGGQQTARTLHFFCTILLVVFVLTHIGMVWLAGFRSRVGAMITGDANRDREGV